VTSLVSGVTAVGNIPKGYFRVAVSDHTLRSITNTMLLRASSGDGVRETLHAGRVRNWFRARCDEAGLPHCSAHGLRKVASLRLAEYGCTVHEGYGDHRSRLIARDAALHQRVPIKSAYNTGNREAGLLEN
jgi:hypothetical protein